MGVVDLKEHYSTTFSIEEHLYILVPYLRKMRDLRLDKIIDCPLRCHFPENEDYCWYSACMHDFMNLHIKAFGNINNNDIEQLKY